MAVLEHETTRELGIRLSYEQVDRLEQAAALTGQSLDEFAATALARAADAALTSPTAHVRPPVRSLDSVLGIFKDEPLMDALMERIREDRRVEIEAIEAEIEAEARKAEAVK